MSKNSRSGRYRWSLKLPALAGFLYLLFTAPFLLNFVRPSVHEDNLYSTIFKLMNTPVTYLIGSFADLIGHVLFHPPTLYKYRLATIIFSLLFWVLSSFVAGALLDRAGIGKTVSHEK